MLYFAHTVVNLVHLLIGFFQLTLCISAIISWFPIVNYENAFLRLLDRINDPVLYPARRLVARSSTLSSMPIDISFIITFIGLSFISALLPQVLI